LRAFPLDFLVFAVFLFALVARPAARRVVLFLFAGFRLTAFFAFRAAALAPLVARFTTRFIERPAAFRCFDAFAATDLAAPDTAAPALCAVPTAASATLAAAPIAEVAASETTRVALPSAPPTASADLVRALPPGS